MVSSPFIYLSNSDELPLLVVRLLTAEVEPTKLVSDSAKLGKPIIVVNIQYRLNIFAFGDEKSPKNLALHDQGLALQWVHEHIAGFGGDPVSTRYELRSIRPEANGQ